MKKTILAVSFVFLGLSIAAYAGMSIPKPDPPKRTAVSAPSCKPSKSEMKIEEELRKEGFNTTNLKYIEGDCQ